MLKRKSLNKIYLTTLVLFIMLVTITFDYLKADKNNIIYETEYVSNLVNTHIYLLNKDNLLVKVDHLLRSNTLEENIEDIINELFVTNKKYNNLKGLIPSNTKLNRITIDDKTANLDFSNDLLKVNKNIEEKVIESIVYSLIELEKIDNVKITIEGNPLTKLEKNNKNLPILLNESIGINKDYTLNSIKDIEKVVIYYVFNDNKDNYYVPVTKYVNSRDSKIKIIIDSLKGNYFSNTNLISYLNRNSNIDFKLDTDILTITFDSLNEDTLESVTYSISNSVFDSVEKINKVIFEVNSKIIDVKSK
ncbi:MAG: GerMN domain-containing protein [Bacilli bacterium]|nr:GerMN domain-containing protein [Bacilli bacterium]